jgi:hypothetical protein
MLCCFVILLLLPTCCLRLDSQTLTFEESLQVGKELKLLGGSEGCDDSLHDGTDRHILDLSVSRATGIMPGATHPDERRVVDIAEHAHHEPVRQRESWI